MMDFSSAAGAYGYIHGAAPVQGDIMAETSVGADLNAPFNTGSLGIGLDNPLFWLLILALVFTGWIFGGFDFGVKRVGGVRAKVGKG